MAEMRLIVAGAGGRMGRTLVKAIAEAKGFALAGALEDARSPLIGWDAGTLAGMPENGVKLTGDAVPLLDRADGIVDFTAPVATVAFAALAAKSGKVHIIGTTGLSAADEGKVAEAAKQAVIVKSSVRRKSTFTKWRRSFTTTAASTSAMRFRRARADVAVSFSSQKNSESTPT